MFVSKNLELSTFSDLSIDYENMIAHLDGNNDYRETYQRFSK